MQKGRTLRILIVDDDRQIAEGAGIRLRAAGFETLFAHDGAAGVAAAREHRPDAIVMDIRMPGMDGVTALRTLKDAAETRDISVVMLSASLIDKEAALDAGARFFIRKPFEGKSLIAAVQQATQPCTAEQQPPRQGESPEPARASGEPSTGGAAPPASNLPVAPSADANVLSEEEQESWLPRAKRS